MHPHFYKKFSSAILLTVISSMSINSFAAQPIDLKHQSLAALRTLSAKDSTIKPLKSDKDFNQTEHVRLKQFYQGYPVHGGDAVLHLPRGAAIQDSNSLQSFAGLASSHGKMNGIFYQGLEQDLANTPRYVFNPLQAEKALQQALDLYQKSSGIKPDVTEIKKDLIVFIGKDNKAHWAFTISFLVQPAHAMPERPTYILDAVTFTVYQAWNNIKTLEHVLAGGVGGNEKIGKLSYDGLEKNFPALDILRDAKKKICYLKNTAVTVKDVRLKKAVVQFACENKSTQHHDLYWNGNLDLANGAYSPSNDALYAGNIVKGIYEKWYGIPVLVKDGKPMMLNMLVHDNMENALWNGSEMLFGDGKDFFYPLVSLGVAAHEVSHGFTEQHSDLEYYGQSGGLNESFSDMASQAAEFYTTGKNTWQLGADIVKDADSALRYMDEPTKDCLPGDYPGDDCSISHVRYYRPGLDVHYSSGIFNKVFYLLSTTPGWDTRKAFQVMLQANSHYWTSTDNFVAAACGVIDATKDYNYSIDSVKTAMTTVGINTSRC